MSKILAVDNQESIQNVMDTILSQHGYDVTIASSYKTILPIIYSNKPDVILLDVMLNNEDGRLICQQLKENRQTKDICIILFSASTNKLKDYKKLSCGRSSRKAFQC